MCVLRALPARGAAVVHRAYRIYMDVDDMYGTWSINKLKVKVYYRSMAKPANFSPQDQQAAFFKFVFHAMAIQLRDRLERKPNATWGDCVKGVEEIMEIKHPRRFRCLEAFIAYTFKIRTE